MPPRWRRGPEEENIGRTRGTSAPDPSGTASVAPLFSRSSPMLASTGPRGQRESTLSALRRARQGDGDALDYLYRRYAPGVFAYVRRILKNDYDAQDVTQQVFVKLATSLDKYDAQRADFSAWLLRVAHNVAVDHLRKQRFTLLSDPIEERAVMEQRNLDDGRSLRETFKALSNPQRDVLLLRDLVGLTPGEVAKRLGKTEAAVNTCHHRARRAAVRSLIAMGSTPATRGAATQPAAAMHAATVRPGLPAALSAAHSASA
jgi:RNA polymerase sigma-70 factor, ECF subfamily